MGPVGAVSRKQCRARSALRAHRYAMPIDRLRMRPIWRQWSLKRLILSLSKDEALARGVGYVDSVAARSSARISTSTPGSVRKTIMLRWAAV